MNKRIVAISVLLLMMLAMTASVFAMTYHELAQSLQNGVRVSETVVNQSKNWKNAEQAEAGWDRFSGQINQAESAVQDAENYVAVNGSLDSNLQRQVNQIKANLRQIKNKMSAFGIPTYWAIDL